eukprot:PITA_29572
MTSFFIFMALFFFHGVALTSAIDVRKMSIEEYINFVNPPAVYKYKAQFGETILCVNFTDLISVKYSQHNTTRGSKKAPKLNLPKTNISNYNASRGNISTVPGVKFKCPRDTVPNIEIKRKDVERAVSVRQFLNRGQSRNDIKPKEEGSDGYVHTHAFVRYVNPTIFAFRCYVSVWRPTVTPDAEFSNSQIWLNNLDNGRLQTIEAGWMVYPKKFDNDPEPHFFVFWTSDSYLNGCYDLDCPGYMPVPNARVVPRLPLAPVSTINGMQYEIGLALELRVEPGMGLVWTLYFQNDQIGHFPARLFTTLAGGGRGLDVGGEVAHSTRPPARMTATQMGSGQFGAPGYGIAAFTRTIEMFGEGGVLLNPETEYWMQLPNCYGVGQYPRTDELWGRNVLFGGPGGANPDCVNV